MGTVLEELERQKEELKKKHIVHIEELRALKLRNLYVHFNDPYLKVEYNEDGTIKLPKDGSGVYGIFDVDDFLIMSADPQQEQLDQYEPENGVRLKSNFLRMLEQLRRNCKYLIQRVAEECKNAKDENREPNFSRFPAFKSYECKKYSAPIDLAKEYYNNADKLYKQFLEERNTFLEIDNLAKGKGLENIDDKKQEELQEKYKQIITTYGNAFHEINEFCYEEAERISRDAKREGKKPDYGEMISMDSNDIFKKNSMDGKTVTKDYLYHVKPFEALENCRNQEHLLTTQDWDKNVIINNFKIFKMKSEEYIDFEKIYSWDNVNKEAVEFVRAIIKSEHLAGAFAGSHYTGTREGYFKIRLLLAILPELNGVILQRFLPEEYTGEIRSRDPKMVYMCSVLGIEPKRGDLFDDSKPNIEGAQELHSLVTWLKKETDSEKMNGEYEDTSESRIIGFDEAILHRVLGQISQRDEELIRDYCREHSDQFTYKKEATA